jgi:hypothetical protein
VGPWLRERRNALIDAALFYALVKWVVPAVVAFVLILASSSTGALLLFLIGYPLLLVGSFTLAAKLEQWFPLEEDGRPRLDDDYVYVWRKSTLPPFGYGRWEPRRKVSNPRPIP